MIQLSVGMGNGQQWLMAKGKVDLTTRNKTREQRRRRWGNATSVAAEANLRNGITSHDSVDRSIYIYILYICEYKYRREQKANDNIRGRLVDPWVMDGEGEGGRSRRHCRPTCFLSRCVDRLTFRSDYTTSPSPNATSKTKSKEAEK